MTRRARNRAMMLLAAACFPAAAALADGPGLPDTISVVLRPGDSVSIGYEANFGFVEAPAGAPLTWICHEVMVPGTSTATPVFYEGSNGLLFASTKQLGVANDPQQSFYRSDDGCDWGTSASLSGVNVGDVAIDPSGQSHVLIASRTGGALGTMNGILVSTNYGVSFAPSTLYMADRFFRTVKFSPTNAQKVWASSTWYMPPQAQVYRSDDGGATWTEFPWTFAPGGVLQTQVDVLSVSPYDDGTAFVRTDGSTDYLLRTTNGAVSFEQVFSIGNSNDVRSVVYLTPAELWLAATDGGTFRSLDGGLSFQQIVTGPKARGMAVDSRGLFVVANNFQDTYALGQLTTGTAFSPIFGFTDLTGAKPCPAGTDVNTICEPLWPALAERLGIIPASPTPTPTAGDDDDDDCHCDLGGTATGSQRPPVFAITTIAMFAALAGALLLHRVARI